MRPWTTPLVSAVAAILCVSRRDSPPSSTGATSAAGGQTERRVAERATPLPDGEVSEFARDAQLVQITSFDCQKVTGSPNERLDAGIPAGAGISGWNNGGPAGAVWNAFELHCAADVRVSCASGSVLTELRVGRSLVAGVRHVLDGQSMLQWSTIVPEAKWEKQLDDRPPTGKYYRTGIFRLTALLSCKKPEFLEPGFASHRSVVAERAFTAGFASGE
jgi:hypothetical protein